MGSCEDSLFLGLGFSFWALWVSGFRVQGLGV